MLVPIPHITHPPADVIWVSVEYVPGLHPRQCGVEPSLYVPGVHAVQDTLQEGQGVTESDIAHPETLVHAVHVEDPAILPVKGGHWVQTVDDGKYENLPAPHETHATAPSALA